MSAAAIVLAGVATAQDVAVPPLDPPPASLETHYPHDDIDFDAELIGPQWLDVAAYPAIRFASTDVTVTGERTAVVTGTLSFMGIEREVDLDVRYNGGYAGMPVYDPQARIGFSATAQFDRSDFGLDIGLPPPGSEFGVGDRVEIVIEAEMLGPPLAETPAD
ncbi:YceI family protein [Maricaulis sp.]|uniref:YceI family protein n=1 Tax=Maricaulis sp. TaxID=1486257 RepID=UPI0026241880|nr:YceI family protein [Maricaulis sp.]